MKQFLATDGRLKYISSAWDTTAYVVANLKNLTTSNHVAYKFVTPNPVLLSSNVTETQY